MDGIFPFNDETDLPTFLALVPPPYSADDRYRQLRYLKKYVLQLGCRCVLVEEHYIDRDFMEDYSVFYSRNLEPLPNHCRRVHFFSVSPDELEKRVDELFRQLETEKDTVLRERSYRRRCRQFSSDCYLGFSVIKPLNGTPVGRTVLRNYEANADDGGLRRFDSTRQYVVHALGIELTVRGLGFQQQDVGVSACATTAIWSCMQKAIEHDAMPVATPAKITSMAGQYSMPHGRMMPSEGLSLDQMCQAIRASGMSPYVAACESLSAARFYLFVAIASGFAPILVLQMQNRGHAITATGMKLTDDVKQQLIGSVWDSSSTVGYLYVHDDRLGPSISARLSGEAKGSKESVRLELEDSDGQRSSWVLSHVLLALYPKIRLSIADLRRIWGMLAKHLLENHTGSVLRTEVWITRGHRYIEAMLMDDSRLSHHYVRRLASHRLSRYVGVIRLHHDNDDWFVDLLVDVTSTYHNLHFVGVVASNSADLTLARGLASFSRCEVIVEGDRSKE